MYSICFWILASACELEPCMGPGARVPSEPTCGPDTNKVNVSQMNPNHMWARYKNAQCGPNEPKTRVGQIQKCLTWAKWTQNTCGPVTKCPMWAKWTQNTYGPDTKMPNMGQMNPIYTRPACGLSSCKRCRRCQTWLTSGPHTTCRNEILPEVSQTAGSKTGFGPDHSA